MLRFDFPSPPPAKHLIAALDELFALGAVTKKGTLTQPLGQQMAEFPLPPQLAKMLLVSGKNNLETFTANICCDVPLSLLAFSTGLLQAKVSSTMEDISVSNVCFY